MVVCCGVTVTNPDELVTAPTPPLRVRLTGAAVNRGRGAGEVGKTIDARDLGHGLRTGGGGVGQRLGREGAFPDAKFVIAPVQVIMARGIGAAQPVVDVGEGGQWEAGIHGSEGQAIFEIPQLWGGSVVAFGVIDDSEVELGASGRRVADVKAAFGSVVPENHPLAGLTGGDLRKNSEIFSGGGRSARLRQFSASASAKIKNPRIRLRAVDRDPSFKGGLSERREQ